jgi:hypothetical protein
MKRSAFLLLCILGLVAMAGSASAATANFQANCASGIPTACTFDASRTPTGQTATSCPGSSVWKYFWDFGYNATSFAWVTPPPHTTSYTYPGASQADVCLTVFCNDGTSATKCHCFANNIGINGCIRPGAGWTP